MVDPVDLNPKTEHSCICKGEGGVAHGLVWNPDKVEFFQLALTNTWPGWSRNRYSLNGRCRIEGKKCGVASVHFEFLPYGPNNKPYYDNIRYRQMDGLLDQVKKPGQSWLVGGDYNHARNDKPDAPGNAAHAHGLVDMEAGDIIRAHRTRDIVVHKQPRMVSLRGHSDHPMLVTEISVPV
jgi:hypothetical protein